MSVSLKIDGLEDFKRQLRELPDHLAERAGHIVLSSAEAAAAAVRSAYPEGPTGNLKRGVKVDRVSVAGAAATARVRSTARHAFMVENGTQVRHTRAGWNRGAMLPGHYFVPVVVRQRRRMVDELIHLVQSEGLAVTGT